MVAMATSLRTSKSAMSSSDSLTPKPTPIIKQRVASYHTTKVIAHQSPKPVIAVVVPQLVVISTTLRHSISAMSSSDSLTPKTTPRIKQRVASYHTTKMIAHRKPKIGYHGNVP